MREYGTSQLAIVIHCQKEGEYAFDQKKKKSVCKHNEFMHIVSSKNSDQKVHPDCLTFKFVRNFEACFLIFQIDYKRTLVRLRVFYSV